MLEVAVVAPEVESFAIVADGGFGVGVEVSDALLEGLGVELLGGAVGEFEAAESGVAFDLRVGDGEEAEVGAVVGGGPGEVAAEEGGVEVEVDVEDDDDGEEDVNQQYGHEPSHGHGGGG